MSISVVIPAKNRAGVLPRAIDSILAQTVPVDEVIVVDDGSDDETPALLAELSRAHPHIRSLRHETGRGAPIARNAGAAAAKGDLIALLDSDDVWKSEKLKHQLRLLEAHPESPAAFCGFEFHYETRPMRVSRTPARVEPGQLHVRNVLGGSSSALIRREAWTRAGGFDPDMPACQDWDFWLRLAALGPLVAHPEPLVEYHFDGGGRISRNRARVEDGHRRIFRTIEKDVPEGKRRLVRAYHAVRMAEIYAEQCYDPLQTISKATSAVFSGRRVDIASLAIKAVGKMLVGSLTRHRMAG